MPDIPYSPCFPTVYIEFNCKVANQPILILSYIILAGSIGGKTNEYSGQIIKRYDDLWGLIRFAAE